MTIAPPHRRTILAGGLATSLAGVANAGPSDPFAGAALYADVVRYAAFGDHRTGTEADLKTSEWLADELERAGLKAKLSPWTHQQFFPARIGLMAGGKSYEAFPLWWPQPTGPNTLRAALKLVEPGANLRGKIALGAVDRVPGTSVRPGTEPARMVAEAAALGAEALVMVTRDPSGELVALNAMAGLDKWPIPVLCVGERDEQALRAAASSGAIADFLLDGRYDPAAKAYETLGYLDGGPEVVVVSTPSSGWFTCAGERGPGVALWLATARWAAAQKRRHGYVFVASSGHELEGVGIRHFVEKDAPPIKGVKTWLHLGAGIATYAYDFAPGRRRKLPSASRARRLMTNDPALEPLLRTAFADIPGVVPQVSSDPGGEMQLIARHGYHVWGFAGGSAFHHMRSDTPEQITGPELLEPVGRAIQSSLTRLLV